jgi:hypothetical protein
MKVGTHVRDPRTYDTSGLGPGNDRQNMEAVMGTSISQSSTPIINCRTICQLSLNTFRSKLVDHFDIMFK